LDKKDKKIKENETGCCCFTIFDYKNEGFDGNKNSNREG
jgi:hypothetical protein